MRTGKKHDLGAAGEEGGELKRPKTDGTTVLATEPSLSGPDPGSLAGITPSDLISVAAPAPSLASSALVQGTVPTPP